MKRVERGAWILAMSVKRFENSNQCRVFIKVDKNNFDLIAKKKHWNFINNVYILTRFYNFKFKHHLFCGIFFNPWLVKSEFNEIYDVTL